MWSRKKLLSTADNVHEDASGALTPGIIWDFPEMAISWGSSGRQAEIGSGVSQAAVRFICGLFVTSESGHSFLFIFLLLGIR